MTFTTFDFSLILFGLPILSSALFTLKSLSYLLSVACSNKQLKEINKYFGGGFLSFLCIDTFFTLLYFNLL